MNFCFKKLAATVISVSIAFGVIAVPSYAADYSALAEDVGYIYNYLDSNDVTNVERTGAAIKSLKVASVVNAMGDELITNELVTNAGYASTNAAKQQVAQFLKETLAVCFSKDTASFKTALENADSSLSTTASKLFNNANISNWLSLYLTARKNASATQNAEDRYAWALGKYAEVYDSLDKLQKENMDLLLSSNNLSADFESIGWTSEKVVNACRNIIALADENHVGEWSLIKAAARSAAIFKLNGATTKLVNAGVKLDENVVRYSPDTLPISLDLSLIIALKSGSRDVTDIIDVTCAGANITEAENMNDATRVTFEKKGAYDVIMHRYSGANDWLSRFRVVIAYDLSPVVWGNIAQDGTVTFNPVNHAEKYVITISKDGTPIAQKTITKGETLKIDFNEWTGDYGSGSYSASAVAYGDLEDLEYSKESASGRYTHTATVGDVQKPEWAQGTPVLQWNAADNAAEYIVTLYGAGDPIVKTVSAPSTTYDFTAELDGKYGTFYATVQAANGDIKGAVSEKSDNLVRVRKYNITGKVVLEGQYRLNTARTDNSGTKISVLENPDFVTYSDKDGNYSITGLPYIQGGYTLVYEHKSYLKSKRHVDLDLNQLDIVIPEREFMLFGDLVNISSAIQINILDISKLLTVFGITKGETLWDEDMSMGDDDIINAELPVIIRNFNKAYTK